MRDMGYGPRPTGQRRRAMSAPRADVLDRLTGQPEPITVAALARATGLHENTVRGHLDGLVARRLVTRERAPAHGRGRPAWLYSAVADARGTSDQPAYAGLAAALAGQIHRSSSNPREDALEAGITWGQELARNQTGAAADSDRQGAPDGSITDPKTRVVRLLEELGFGPRPGDDRGVVKLTRCPLLAAAYRYPDVVCAVHLGVVRGALEVYGGDPDSSDLEAFAEPGACRLDLAASPDRAGLVVTPTDETR